MAQAAPVLGSPVHQVSAGRGCSCLPALERPPSAQPPGTAVPFCKWENRGPECRPSKRQGLGPWACTPTHACPPLKVPVAENLLPSRPPGP